MSLESDVECARLSAQVEAGLINIYRRFDDVSRELADIKAEVKRTNGRVTVLETTDSVRQSTRSYAEQQALRERDGLQWYVVLIISIIGGTIAVLTFFGKLP